MSHPAFDPENYHLVAAGLRCSATQCSVDAVVEEVDVRHPLRAITDPDGLFKKWECLGVSTYKTKVRELASGKCIKNLPCAGLDLKPGQRVRITVEVLP